MASTTPRMDELVKDYLLYRGLTGCMRALENELKVEKDKSLRADKIVEQISSYVSSHELSALWDYWNSLNIRFFSRLEQRHMSTVQKLEQSLLKFYVIVAYQAQRPDKVREFFEVMAPELDGQDAFKDWFAFPFLKNVEEHTSFAMYFSRQWQDTFSLSLSNFLSIVIQAMNTPSLLHFEEEQKRVKSLQEENYALKQQLKALNADRGDTSVNKPRGLAASGNTLELMDDFFLAGEQQTKNERPRPSPVKTEKKKSSIFSSANLLGFKAQPSASTQQPKRVTGYGMPIFNIQNNNKITKSKTTDATKTPPIKTKNDQNANKNLPASLTKHPRGNVADVPAPKNTVTDPEGQGHKVDDRLIVASTALPAKKVPESGDKNRTFMPDSLRDVKDGLRKRSSPAKIAGKMPSGFTSYITKPSPSDAMAINYTDNDGPFILLAQESYNEHSSTVTSVRFSYTSQYISSIDQDGIVKIWTWSPQPVTKATVMLKPAFLSAEWANKTDRHVLLGTKTGNIRLYDVRENKSVCEVPTDSGYPNVVALCPNPSGTQFVSSGMAERSPTSDGSDTQTVRQGRLSVWELKTMKVLSNLLTQPNPVATNCMTFNHNGQLLLTGGTDGHVRLYDVNQTICIAEWTAHTGHVTAIQFSSDETSCYTMGSDDKFLQWSMRKCGQQLADIPLHGGACNPDSMLTNSDQGSYTPRGKLFAFDAEGNYILTCGKRGGVIYQLGETTASSVMELHRHWSPVSTIDWSPAVDTRVCLTASFDGRIQVSTFLSR